MTPNPGANTNAGDKITLALLGQKMDTLADGQDEVLNTLKGMAAQIHELDKGMCLNKEEIGHVKGDIAENIKPHLKTEKKLSWIATILAAASTAILGYLTQR